MSVRQRGSRRAKSQFGAAGAMFIACGFFVVSLGTPLTNVLGSETARSFDGVIARARQVIRSANRTSNASLDGAKQLLRESALRQLPPIAKQFETPLSLDQIAKLVSLPSAQDLVSRLKTQNGWSEDELWSACSDVAPASVGKRLLEEDDDLAPRALRQTLAAACLSLKPRNPGQRNG